MNTKTDGISSGLVAVAWLAPSNYEWPSHFFSMTEIRNGEPLVRLSDAEAIIAAKDAEIARLRNQLEHYICVSSKKAEQIKELEAELETERMRLAGCGVAAIGYFDGCKEEYRSASLDDTLRLYAKHNKQSAALKLAREALFDMQDSYAAVHGWKDSFVIAATTAIAAIDSLQKGE